jgi:uncharacterized protein
MKAHTILGVDPQGRDGPVTQNLFKPLSQSEIEELDRFLLERIDEGAVTEDSDEGVFCVSELDDREVTIVDEWCEGYLRGIGLAAEEWNLADEELQTLLLPIVAFTEIGEWEAHDNPDFPPIEKVQELIAPTARAVFEYWLERLMGFPSDNGLASTPVARSEPKVGRNDPCPCGSGKKYKQCCLH